MAPWFLNRSFIASQYRNLPIVPGDCTGQAYIVTGSNTGLGFEAAKHFVRLGAARVIIAVRSASKGNEAKEAIESATGRTGVAEVWELDLASNNSIRAFASRASKELDRIDAVVENAGVAHAAWTEAEGTETTIQVNVIGTFLLAFMLLPTLERSARKWGITPHLTIVSSGVQAWAKFAEGQEDDIFAALATPSAENMADRYPVSKLMECYAVRELARLLPVSRSGVVVNALSPGLCYSDLARNVGWFQWLGLASVRLLVARSAEMGSRTLLHAAVAGPESHGLLCGSCEIYPGGLEAYEETPERERMQKKVWEQLVAKLESIEPGCVRSVV